MSSAFLICLEAGRGAKIVAILKTQVIRSFLWRIHLVCRR
jgi:hypothetical protein